MLASALVSAAGGRLSQPVAGGVKLHIFLKSNMRSETSKPIEDTDEGKAGYSLPHWVALRILFFLSVCSIERDFVRTPCRPAGGWILSNLFLNAWDPTSTRRRHRRAKFVVSLVDTYEVMLEAMLIISLAVKRQIKKYSLSNHDVAQRYEHHRKKIPFATLFGVRTWVRSPRLRREVHLYLPLVF